MFKCSRLCLKWVPAWLRSPHSARNVSAKASRNVGENSRRASAGSPPGAPDLAGGLASCSSASCSSVSSSCHRSTQCRTRGRQARAEFCLQHCVCRSASMCWPAGTTKCKIKDRRVYNDGVPSAPCPCSTHALKCKTAVAQPRQSASLQRQAGPPRGVNQRAQGMQGVKQPRILCLVLAIPPQAVVLQYGQHARQEAVRTAMQICRPESRAHPTAA